MKNNQENTPQQKFERKERRATANLPIYIVFGFILGVLYNMFGPQSVDDITLEVGSLYSNVQDHITVTEIDDGFAIHVTAKAGSKVIQIKTGMDDGYKFKQDPSTTDELNLGYPINTAADGEILNIELYKNWNIRKIVLGYIIKENTVQIQLRYGFDSFAHIKIELEPTFGSYFPAKHFEQGYSVDTVLGKNGWTFTLHTPAGTNVINLKLDDKNGQTFLYDSVQEVYLAQDYVISGNDAAVDIPIKHDKKLKLLYMISSSNGFPNGIIFALKDETGKKFYVRIDTTPPKQS